MLLLSGCVRLASLHGFCCCMGRGKEKISRSAITCRSQAQSLRLFSNSRQHCTRSNLQLQNSRVSVPRQQFHRTGDHPTAFCSDIHLVSCPSRSLKEKQALPFFSFWRWNTAGTRQSLIPLGFYVFHADKGRAHISIHPGTGPSSKCHRQHLHIFKELPRAERYYRAFLVRSSPYPPWPGQPGGQQVGTPVQTSCDIVVLASLTHTGTE